MVSCRKTTKEGCHMGAIGTIILTAAIAGVLGTGLGGLLIIFA